MTWPLSTPSVSFFFFFKLMLQPNSTTYCSPKETQLPSISLQACLNMVLSPRKHFHFPLLTTMSLLPTHSHSYLRLTPPPPPSLLKTSKCSHGFLCLACIPLDYKCLFLLPTKFPEGKNWDFFHLRIIPPLV